MKLRAHLGAYFASLALIALWTWPLARDPAHLVPDNTDPRLFSWVMISVFRNLLTQPHLLLHGGGFYPHGLSLTFAEPLVTPALVAGPLFWWTGNPYLAYNVTLLLFWAASGWAMYAVTYWITRRHGGGGRRDADLHARPAADRVRRRVPDGDHVRAAALGLRAGPVSRNPAAPVPGRLPRGLLASGHRRVVLRGHPGSGTRRPRAVVCPAALVGLAPGGACWRPAPAAWRWAWRWHRSPGRSS